MRVALPGPVRRAAPTGSQNAAQAPALDDVALQFLAAAAKANKQGSPRRAAVGTLPAIPFEIVQP